MKSKRPIKVLQVLHALGVGGAETWLMELLRYWSRTGAVECDFLLTGGVASAFDKEAKDLGANLYYLKYGRRQIANFIPRYRRILGEGKYQVIHDHSDYASGWHYLLGVGHLPPVRLTHVHNAFLYRERHAVSTSRRFVLSSGRHLVKFFATHVGGTSAEALSNYGFPVNYTRPIALVAHCGFTVERYSQPCSEDRRAVLDEFGWPSDAKIVLFAGRLDDALEIDHPNNEKNSWLAVRIVQVAHSLDPRIRLLMAGAGDARVEICQRIDQAGLQEQLRLLGVRRDIPRLMRAADVLLFPSAQEGLGMVAVEAQAAGLPVVASTAVPREAIIIPEHYRAVSLLEPPEVWAATILEATELPRLSVETCRSAIQTSPFSIEMSAERLETIYRQGTDARASS